MKRIKHPEFKIIRTSPSSLGTIDFYIIAYEKTEFDIWKELNENEIAEEIYETGEYKGFYVIHSSTTRGEDISTLDGKKEFVFNRINCESILSYHCLAIKVDGSYLNLRTGFHESSNSRIGKIIDWNSITEISNGFQEIEFVKDEFYKLYNRKVDEWKKQITMTIVNTGFGT